MVNKKYKLKKKINKNLNKNVKMYLKNVFIKLILF